MGMESDSIQSRYVVRSDNAPGNPFAGQIWVDTSGNNTETNVYNESGTAWELLVARGPDNPDNPVEGSIWRDTGAGEMKQYDGTSWGNIGITSEDAAMWGEGFAPSFSG